MGGSGDRVRGNFEQIHRGARRRGVCIDYWYRRLLMQHAQDEKPSTKIILEAPILPESGTEDVYQRQGGKYNSVGARRSSQRVMLADTIISWNDPSLQADLALRYDTTLIQMLIMLNCSHQHIV